MLNSAASMFVREDAATAPEGRADLAYFSSDPKAADGHDHLDSMKSRFASLSISSESKASVKAPPVVISNPAPALQVTENPKEVQASKSSAEKPKRQLPRTPKSLYSTAASQPDTDPHKNQEKSPPTDSENPRKNQQSKKKKSTEKTLNGTSSVSSDSTCSSPDLPDKPANRQLLFNQTHIAGYKFVARHSDEIDLEAGDPVCVDKMHKDLWYEGQNIRTGKRGIFPSRYVSDILRGSASKDSLSSSHDDQFFLRFLGSVEVSDFKGNEIICDAMRKIVKQHQLTSVSRPPQCTLEVSPRGIKIIEHQNPAAGQQQSKRQSKRKLGKLFEKEQKHGARSSSHFFSLKNVTFCGCHPTNARFFAFITKHPEEHRFACHVFMSEYSTEPVAFSVGQAFKEFYAEFMDFQAPVEDFYIE